LPLKGLFVSLNVTIVFNAISRRQEAQKITGIARGLSESAIGGRVSQRPVILSSAGNPPEADK
jgi:hypothetical protein